MRAKSVQKMLQKPFLKTGVHSNECADSLTSRSELLQAL